MSPGCRWLVAAALMLPVTHLLSATPATAQDQPPEAAGPNVVVDLKVTTDPETRPREVRLLVEDRDTGNVNSGVVGGQEFVVSVAPRRLNDGAIRLNISLYLTLGGQTEGPDNDPLVEYRKVVTVVLQDGEPLVVLETTGPDGARGLTVEATATTMGTQRQAQVAPAGENIRRIVAEGNVRIEGDRITSGSIELEVAPDGAGSQPARP